MKKILYLSVLAALFAGSIDNVRATSQPATTQEDALIEPMQSSIESAIKGAKTPINVTLDGSKGTLSIGDKEFPVELQDLSYLALLCDAIKKGANVESLTLRNLTKETFFAQTIVMQTIAPALQGNTKLRKIVLENVICTRGGQNTFIDALKNNLSITDINFLGSSNFPTEQQEAIKRETINKCIKSFKSPINVTLDGSSKSLFIGDKKFSVTLSDLSYLALLCHAIKDGANVKSLTLKDLMQNNQFYIASSVIQAIAPALQGNTKLQQIVLDNTQFDHDGQDAFIDALKNSPVTNIQISKIASFQIKELASIVKILLDKSLKADKHLKVELNGGWHKVDKDDKDNLTYNLKYENPICINIYGEKNTLLGSFERSISKGQDWIVRAPALLCDAIKDSANVKSLTLKNFKAESSAMNAIAPALKGNTALQQIALDNIYSTPNGRKAFIEALKNSQITNIEISKGTKSEFLPEELEAIMGIAEKNREVAKQKFENGVKQLIDEKLTSESEPLKVELDGGLFEVKSREFSYEGPIRINIYNEKNPTPLASFEDCIESDKDKTLYCLTLLCDAIKEGANVKSLTLKNCRVGDDSKDPTAKLVEVIQGNTKLQELLFDGVAGLRDTKKIREALYNNAESGTNVLRNISFTAGTSLSSYRGLHPETRLTLIGYDPRYYRNNTNDFKDHVKTVFLNENREFVTQLKKDEDGNIIFDDANNGAEEYQVPDQPLKNLKTIREEEKQKQDAERLAKEEAAKKARLEEEAKRRAEESEEWKKQPKANRPSVSAKPAEVTVPTTYNYGSNDDRFDDADFYLGGMDENALEEMRDNI